MDKTLLDQVVAQAKSLQDLLTALADAQDTTPEPGADVFTQEEADEVKAAVQALVTPTETPAPEPTPETPEVPEA